MASIQIYSEQLDPYGEKYNTDDSSICHKRTLHNISQLIFDDDSDFVDMNVSQHSTASQFNEEPINLDGFEVYEAPLRKKSMEHDENCSCRWIVTPLHE